MAIDTTKSLKVCGNNESGIGGHSITEEERALKQLHVYTQNNVSVNYCYKAINYDFPSVVFSSQSTQEEVYDDIMTD